MSPFALKMKLIAQQGDRQFWLLHLEPPYKMAIPRFGKPFVAVVVACGPALTPCTQAEISAQLVANYCRFMLAWGINASSWDDSVDYAFLATNPDYNPPDDRHVITTWHDDETIEDVIWFALLNASFDSHDFHDYLALVIGTNAEIEAELLATIRRRLVSPTESEQSDPPKSPVGRDFEP